MRVVPARRVRVRAAILAVSIAGVLSCVGAGAFAASAGAATLQVASTTATPEQAVPVQIGLSGTADSGSSSYVQAVVRPSGGVACQPDLQSDLSAAGSADTVLYGATDESVAPGPYAVTATFKPEAPGGYQVCAWLQQSVSGTDQTVAGPATLSFSARSPQVSQLSVALPQAPTPNVTFQIGFTTQTDQQLNLYAVIKKAGALPCAASYELEQEQGAPETTLLGAGSPQVFGGPTTTTITNREKTGSYLICSWIEGPTFGEVDGALSTPVTVGTPTTTPPPAAKPAKLNLRLGTLTASRKHGISLAGRTAAAFTGHLAAVAACGSARTQTQAKVSNGQFTTHLSLPSGCRNRKTVSVKVSWAGSSAFARASASRSLRIRA